MYTSVLICVDRCNIWLLSFHFLVCEQLLLVHSEVVFEISIFTCVLMLYKVSLLFLFGFRNTFLVSWFCSLRFRLGLLTTFIYLYFSFFCSNRFCFHSLFCSFYSSECLEIDFEDYLYYLLCLI